MTINKETWLGAMLLAVALHGAALIGLANRMVETGAKDKGAHGIEINLGMLGNMGEKTETKKAKANPKPKVVKQKPKPKPKRKRKPIRKAVKPKQQTQILSKLTPVKRVEKIIEKPQEIVKMPLIAEATPVVPIAQADDASGGETVTQFKKTTGIGQDSEAGGKIEARISYTGIIAAKIKKYKRYPRFSRRRHEEGIVKLFFKLDRMGKVVNFRIVSSSGHDRLDKEVLRMLEKAQPFPPFPSEIKRTTLSMTIPVTFRLH